MKNKKPIVIGFFGGPGSGKSTTAARVFSHFKMKRYKCELVTEFAKDLTHQNSYDVLKNQIFVFGNQHQRMFQLIDNVDLIITDSPLILSLIYCNDELRQYLEPLVLHENNKFDNINIRLIRTKPYDKYGRTQNEDEAKQIDVDIKNLLEELSLEHHDFVYPVDDDLDKIVELVENKIKVLNE